MGTLMSMVQGGKEPPGRGARIAVALGIVLSIAALHALRVGSYLHGAWHTYYYSYASDLVLPVAAYMLLFINERSLPFLRSWAVKAGIVFGAAAFAETMQGLGVHLLGTTFDPLDYAAYALGSVAAALLDKQVLERLLPFWRPERGSS